MRFEVEDFLGNIRNVAPLMGQDNNISYSREDDRRYDFKKEIKEVTFIGKDFEYFHAIETGLLKCQQHIFRIYNECGDHIDDDLKFTGYFSGTSGDWDLESCTVKFKIKQDDPYRCFDENDKDINIFDTLITRQTIQLGVSLSYTYDSEKNEAGKYYYENLKIILNTPCDFVAPSGWITEDLCGQVVPGRMSYSKTFIEFTSDTPIIENQPFNSIDNAFLLQEIFQYLLDSLCYGLTLRSEILGWNAIDPFTYDLELNDLTRYQNLKLVQKSDVKRANALNNATKGELNFTDLLTGICEILNLGYAVIGNEFRIEHISFFERNYGTDFTKSKKNEFNLKGTRKYTYDQSKLPRFETFAMMEAQHTDFVGKDIEYFDFCVNNEVENKNEINVDFITTDVLFCLENPSSESDLVSDDGFVLIACDQNGQVIYEPGILTSATPLNNTLSWAHLHRDLWKHGRVLKEGYMNGQVTEFYFTVPSIKQKKFSVVLDCNQIRDFDPLEKIRSTLGWGAIQTAELNLRDCTLDLELNIEEIQLKPVTQEYGDFDADFDTDFD